MINLTHPSCTSPKTIEKLKKFSCVGEMAESIFEEYKDQIALVDSGVVRHWR